MLGQHARVGLLQDVTQDERGDDRVVERSHYRDELGDQIDRRDEPYDREPEPELRTTRHP